MLITRATDYAVRALLHMAKQPTGEIVLKKDICQMQDITPAFLTKILQPLIKAGIVGSQRGVGGGFFLLKKPEDISLLDVIKAEEGQLYLNQCLAESGFCDRSVHCPVHAAWGEVRGELMGILSRYTFAQLLEQEEVNLQKLRASAAARGNAKQIRP